MQIFLEHLSNRAAHHKKYDWWHLFNRAVQHKIKIKKKSAFLHFFLCAIVDELFKEANIRLNGNVNYEEFTQMVMLPPVDY